ncbi:hypothetical protein MRX96_002793 [Rhipicephalus microplus]
MCGKTKVASKRNVSALTKAACDGLFSDDPTFIKKSSRISPSAFVATLDRFWLLHFQEDGLEDIPPQSFSFAVVTAPLPQTYTFFLIFACVSSCSVRYTPRLLPAGAPRWPPGGFSLVLSRLDALGGREQLLLPADDEEGSLQESAP